MVLISLPGMAVVILTGLHLVLHCRGYVTLGIYFSLGSLVVATFSVPCVVPGTVLTTPIVYLLATIMGYLLLDKLKGYILRLLMDCKEVENSLSSTRHSTTIYGYKTIAVSIYSIQPTNH